MLDWYIYIYPKFAVFIMLMLTIDVPLLSGGAPVSDTHVKFYNVTPLFIPIPRPTAIPIY